MELVAVGALAIACAAAAERTSTSGLLLAATDGSVPDCDTPVNGGVVESLAGVLGSVLSVLRLTSGNSCADRLGDKSCPVRELGVPTVPAPALPVAKSGVGVC